MLELHTKKDIDQIVYSTLKNSKSWDVLPTPVDKIINYSELVLRSDIDITKVENEYRHRVSDSLLRAISKFRGLFDRGTKEIYLDLTQAAPRQNFVKLHEVGHGIIPWQKELCEFLDDDDSLDPEIKEQFEAEANYFASASLFQLDRFSEEMKQLELGLNSAMHLAKLFGSSNHAALRRYVECSKKRCALIVLENEPALYSLAKYKLRNYFQSENFTKAFGEIPWQKELGYTWAFVQDYYHGRRHKTDGSFTYISPSGNVDFQYHFFNSTYNAFVLLFPKGEITKARKKVLIKGV